MAATAAWSPVRRFAPSARDDAIDDSDDTYIYTNEFGDYAGTFGHKTTFKDTDGGKDAINAAAVTSNSWINLSPGKHSEIDGKR